MIIYSKTLWGLPLLSRIYGSALPRALAPALIAGLITFGLTFVGSDVMRLWSHPYAYNAFVLLVSFVLTFRSNFAYQRHWEAYSNTHLMGSKWVDAAMQIVMFDRHPQLPAAEGSRANTAAPTASELMSQHRAFVAELVHLISLLHAVSCQALRRDPDLHNLTRHSKDAAAPPSDPALLRSVGSGSAAAGGAGAGADGSNSSAGGAVAASAAVAAAAAVAGGSNATGSAAPHSPRSPHSAAAATASGAEQVGTPPAGWGVNLWGRGTNIVGSANWRDIFMLRGSSETIRTYNAAQPLPVVGGTSLEELAALGCSRHYSSSDWQQLELTPQQQKQRQQLLPRARSLSQLFSAASHSLLSQHTYQQHSGSGRERGQQQLAGRSRSSSGTPDVSVSMDDDTGADAAAGGGALSHQQQGHVVRISPPAAAQHGGGSSSKSSRRLFAFPIGSNSNGTNKAPAVAASAAAAAAVAASAGLKRSPSTRFLLISRNCSCCKGHLPYMDRPLLVMAWLHELLLQRQSEGGLRMPAPVLARAYSCLSEGLQGFEQCRKLADTPFPFPWAQFILVMLVLFTLTLPLLVLAYVPNTALAVVLTVVTVATYWTVNEVARDVEDPFLYEPNDMPFANSQYHINELLLSLAQAYRPRSNISSMRRAAAPVLSPLGQHSSSSAGAAGKRPSQPPPPTPWLSSHHQQQQQQQQQRHRPAAAAAGAAAGSDSAPAGPANHTPSRLGFGQQEQQSPFTAAAAAGGVLGAPLAAAGAVAAGSSITDSNGLGTAPLAAAADVAAGASDSWQQPLPEGSCSLAEAGEGSLTECRESSLSAWQQQQQQQHASQMQPVSAQHWGSVGIEGSSSRQGSLMDPSSQ